jgi:hypothetical protein
MRILGVHGPRVPGSGPLEVDYLPAGLVAILGPDGRSRRAIYEALAGGAGPGATYVTSPRVPDPLLARLPAGLTDRLRTGREIREPETAVAEGARALAWTLGLDRVEAARTRLARLRGDPSGRGEGPPETLLARIRELEGAPSEVAALEEELQELRADDAEVAGDLEAATMSWLRERQDAETQLQAYRDRARELKVRLKEVEAKGPDAPCPTCRRPLRDHREGVQEFLRDEWDGVVQDGSWWRRRREQLEFKPLRLQELESQAVRLHARMEELVGRVEAARDRARELEDLRAQLAGMAPPAGERRPVALPEASSGVFVSDDVADAAEKALSAVATSILDEARLRLLDRSAAYLVRLTDGRILGARWVGSGRLEAVGPGGSLGGLGDEDAAALSIAVRLAAVELVWESAGARDPAFLVGHAFDRLDEAVKVRAADLLADRVRRGLVQVLVVTRGEVVDLIPEAFDGVLELRREAGAEGVAVLRPVAAGMGVVRLVGARGGGATRAS